MRDHIGAMVARCNSRIRAMLYAGVLEEKAVLTAADRGKLARICGLFGSSFDGERAAAATKADQFLRQRGLTWEELLASPAPQPKQPKSARAGLRRRSDPFAPLRMA